jgi:hypothetical protein
MKYVRIRVQRLAELLRSEAELLALQAGGVDNWDWYGDCFTEEVEELLDADDEDLVKSEGFTIQDTDDLFG